MKCTRNDCWVSGRSLFIWKDQISRHLLEADVVSIGRFAPQSTKQGPTAKKHDSHRGASDALEILLIRGSRRAAFRRPFSLDPFHENQCCSFRANWKTRGACASVICPNAGEFMSNTGGIRLTWFVTLKASARN